MLSRDEVKQFLEGCQMNHPTEDQVLMLHGHLVRQLIVFDGIVHDGESTYRPGRIKLTKGEKSLMVSSYYFKDRQGVTFEPDGWIGIAGWADDTNVQPILRALISWAEEVSGAEFVKS